MGFSAGIFSQRVFREKGASESGPVSSVVRGVAELLPRLGGPHACTREDLTALPQLPAASPPVALLTPQKLAVEPPEFLLLPEVETCQAASSSLSADGSNLSSRSYLNCCPVSRLWDPYSSPISV